MGFKHLVEYDPETGQYAPTSTYEEEGAFMDFIDEYDNDTFWDELTDRLAFRDLIRQEGEERVRSMPPEERFEKLCSMRDRYVTEFEQHGLIRIQIDRTSTG